jgi:hypothetical protein
VKRPLYGVFDSETAQNLTAMYLTVNGHSPTDVSVRSGLTVMLRPWSLVKANGFILVSECLPGVTSAYSKAVNYI